MNWRKIRDFKIPESWHDPDSFWFNLGSLLFWAVIIGVAFGIVLIWG